jgi:integrase
MDGILGTHTVVQTALRKYLDHALAAIGVKDASGNLMRYTFHDFRRIFITDAIMHGMPPHIAQLVAGHRDINTTMGYKKSRELHQTGEFPQVA